jgi:hypothetical protein
MQTAQIIQIVGALLNMGAFALLHFEIAWVLVTGYAIASRVTGRQSRIAKH